MALGKGDGTIVLYTEVDTTGIKNGVSKLKLETKAYGEQSKKSNDTASGAFIKTSTIIKGALISSIVIATKKLLDFSLEASKTATQTEASVLRIIDIYGEASEALGSFIDANASALGLSKSSAAQFSAVYGNLFSVWADQSTNAALTVKYLNMTAVVASKTGRTMEDVQERIRSGLLGNTEAIEDLGIFVGVKTVEMTDAFKQIANGRSWAQLDAQEQQQIRTLAIMEQATQKYGNKVAETTALTRARYDAAYQDFANTWGKVVNLVLIPVLEVLTDIFEYATSVIQAIAGISGKIVDVSVVEEQGELIGASVENQDKLTDSVNETAKAQKKLLAGFDDLQILSEQNSDSGVLSGNSALSIPSIDITEVAKSPIDISELEKTRDVLKEIKEIFMGGFWIGMGDVDASGIKSDITSIKESIIEIFEDPDVNKSFKKFGKSFVESIGKTLGSSTKIGDTMGANIVGGVEKYLASESPTVKSGLVSIFDANDEISTISGNLWTSFATIFSGFASENGQEVTASIVELFSNAGLSVASIGSQMGVDFMNSFAMSITDNEETLKLSFDNLLINLESWLNPINDLFNGFYTDLENLYNEHISPLFTSISSGVSEIVGSISKVYNENLAPILNELGERFQKIVDEKISPAITKITDFFGSIADFFKVVWEQYLQPFIKWLVETFGPVFSEIFGLIGAVVLEKIGIIIGCIGSWFEILGGFIDFLTGVFSGDMTKAWGGIKQIWSGITSFFENKWTGVRDIFSAVGTFFVNIFSDAWDAVVEWWDEKVAPIFTKEYWENVAKNIGNGFLSGVEGIVNGIINAFEKAINWIIDGLNKISIEIPDWVPTYGGKTFGISLKKVDFDTIDIPELAKGAVIPPNREFLAVLGDQKHGTNIEAPLQTIVDAFNIALANGGGNNGNTTVVLEVDGREFGHAVIEQGQRESRRLGTRMVLA